VSEINRDDHLLAMLYATGQLDGESAAAFEGRLADDQAARDALCSAVRLQWAMSEQPNVAPDPAYRERVRRRLRVGTGRPFLSRKLYGLRPAAWAVGGAAVAAALLLAIHFGTSTAPLPVTPPAAVAEQAPVQTAADADAAQDWPELMTGEHLTRAVEESRRKLRSDEHRVVRMEENAARVRSAPVYRQ
jgi:anti-sigma-K factor RskA